MSELLTQLQNAASNATSSNKTQSDMIVDAYKRTQQSKVDALTSKQKTLEARVSFLNSLRSKVDALFSQIDTFTSNTINDKFKAKSITSSNNAVATATSTGDADIGLNSLKVSRLATNDSLITQRLSISDSFGLTSGTIKINGFNIEVNFTGDETNEEAMKKIAKAINNTTDINLTASYVKDTNTTGRLTFTSKNSGESNKIIFEDTELAAKLGLNSNTLNPTSNDRLATSGANAYYKTNNPENLNAKLNINGIDVVRESNSISDLLNGVTINLIKPQEDNELPLTLTTSVGTTEVQNLVKPFLDTYNEILKFIKSNPTQMRGDTSINGLYSKLRAIPSQSITPISGQDTSLLSEIGVTINKDGTLSLNDTTKLTDVLKDNPLKVANLFTGSDGLAKKLNDVISNLAGSDGLLINRSLSLSKQIDQTKQKTTELNAKIDRQAQALRKEYESALRVYLKAQQQNNLLGTFPTTT